MKYQLLNGDNRETLKTLKDNSIDAIVTDPPYGIDFLGKDWDANTGALETYQQCLRVLKPGGHILAFSAARTYHHLAITLERAGFEIRDQLMWIYSSGFPKSQDVGRSIQRSLGVKEKKSYKHTSPRIGGDGEYGKTSDNDGQVVITDSRAQQWSGWGTALKPAHEPICLARKPLKLSIAKNCQKWGTGALNIDATRIPYNGPTDVPVPHGGKARQHKDNPGWMADNTGYGIIENPEINPIGRFPSNVLGEIPEYQKYFYCPKVSRSERHVGFDLTRVPVIEFNDPETGERFAVGLDAAKLPGNNHPTVKPVELMKYLIKLITPPGGTVLDPFNGSGSTGMAAVSLGFKYIGCELDTNYVEISKRRIDAYTSAPPDVKSTPAECKTRFNDFFGE